MSRPVLINPVWADLPANGSIIVPFLWDQPVTDIELAWGDGTGGWSAWGPGPFSFTVGGDADVALAVWDVTGPLVKIAAASDTEPAEPRDVIVLMRCKSLSGEQSAEYAQYLTVYPAGGFGDEGVIADWDFEELNGPWGPGFPIDACFAVDRETGAAAHIVGRRTPTPGSSTVVTIGSVSVDMGATGTHTMIGRIDRADGMPMWLAGVRSRTPLTLSTGEVGESITAVSDGFVVMLQGSAGNRVFVNADGTTLPTLSLPGADVAIAKINFDGVWQWVTSAFRPGMVQRADTVEGVGDNLAFLLTTNAAADTITVDGVTYGPFPPHPIYGGGRPVVFTVDHTDGSVTGDFTNTSWARALRPRLSMNSAGNAFVGTANDLTGDGWRLWRIDLPSGAQTAVPMSHEPGYGTGIDLGNGTIGFGFLSDDSTPVDFVYDGTVVPLPSGPSFLIIVNDDLSLSVVWAPAITNRNGRFIAVKPIAGNASSVWAVVEIEGAAATDVPTVVGLGGAGDFTTPSRVKNSFALVRFNRSPFVPSVFGEVIADGGTFAAPIEGIDNYTVTGRGDKDGWTFMHLTRRSYTPNRAEWRPDVEFVTEDSPAGFNRQWVGMFDPNCAVGVAAGGDPPPRQRLAAPEADWPAEIDEDDTQIVIVAGEDYQDGGRPLFLEVWDPAAGAFKIPDDISPLVVDDAAYGRYTIKINGQPLSSWDDDDPIPGAFGPVQSASIELTPAAEWVGTLQVIARWRLNSTMSAPGGGGPLNFGRPDIWSPITVWTSTVEAVDDPIGSISGDWDDTLEDVATEATFEVPNPDGGPVTWDLSADTTEPFSWSSMPSTIYLDDGVTVAGTVSVVSGQGTRRVRLRFTPAANVTGRAEYVQRARS